MSPEQLFFKKYPPFSQIIEPAAINIFMTNSNRQRLPVDFKYEIDSGSKLKKPICYSCQDSYEVITGWTAIDPRDGQRYNVCIDCLDAYTTLSCPIDVYETDWTDKKNLKRLRARFCIEDGSFFITADGRQKYRADRDDPSFDLDHDPNLNHEEL